MGQSSTKQAHEEQQSIQHSTSSSTINTFKPKKYLSKIELLSLKYIFQDLKTTFPDGFTCIEPKKFLEHLNLPSEVEPAGVLLFKSFSYLGSYPSCSSVGPIPISFEAFITAYTILIGKLDERPSHILSETLFFQSLSILPSPKNEEEEEIVGEEPVVVDHPPPPITHTRGLSLAELGVDFSDLDLDSTHTAKENEMAEKESSKILCRDLIELFVLLLWLGEADKETHDFKLLREMANSIVNNIKPILQSTKAESNEEEELPCISHLLFCQWKEKFSPHLFKPIQSLVTKSFGYYKPEDTSRLLPEDKVPTADTTDILTPLYSTLLSWTLPEEILITKKWTRLYSADGNGFSMNRFESHVFKYPGPTLFIMEIDAILSDNNKRASTIASSNSKRQSMIIGAYITQPWKHSKQFWGTNECFLFELSPDFDIFRPIINKRTGESTNDHYIYYHHEFGIGFGPTDNHLPNQHHNFIISLQNTLQEGIYQHEAYPENPSFESATKSRKNLDFHYKFDTENMEVFGLGNEKDRLKQAKEWKFEKQEADRRAGLNIRQADGQLDKELLKMAGIIEERQER